MTRSLDLLAVLSVGIMAQNIPDPASSVWAKAVEIGIWALIALYLGKLILKDKDSLTERVRGLEDYIRDKFEKQLTANNDALERTAKVMESCPAKKSVGVLAGENKA